MDISIIIDDYYILFSFISYLFNDKSVMSNNDIMIYFMLIIFVSCLFYKKLFYYHISFILK